MNKWGVHGLDPRLCGELETSQIPDLPVNLSSSPLLYRPVLCFYSGLSVRYLYGKGHRYLPDHPQGSPEFPKSMRAESCHRAPALS